MVNFGNGFTWTEVYQMPIHWRRFYFDKLLKLKEKEAAEIEKVNKAGKRGSNIRVKR